MNNCRLKYVKQDEVNSILKNIENNKEKIDQMIAEILTGPSCDPRHLLTQEELQSLKERYSDIL